MRAAGPAAPPGSPRPGGEIATFHQLCDRRLRDAGITTPVLFLTARDDMRDKIQGLTVGGDDYVTKPFSLEEVLVEPGALQAGPCPFTTWHF